MKKLIERLLLLYGVHFPYHPGKWLVVECVLNRLGNSSSDSRPFVNARRSGIHWDLDTRCLMQRAVYYLSVYERNETMLVQQLVNEGDVCLDVGANFGYYSMLIARETNDNARIYSFEPVAELYAQPCSSRSPSSATPGSTSQIILS